MTDAQTEVSRAEGRSNQRIPLDLYVNKMIDGVPHLARVRNMSREGLFLQKLLEPVSRPDAHVAVEFVLPGTEDLIWADAEVVHDGEDGVGLRFLDLTPRQATLLGDFVAGTSVC